MSVPGEKKTGQTLFDPIRSKAVADTPEERVRQAVLGWLLGEIGVPARLIAVEAGLSLFETGNRHRVDIAVMQPGGGGLAPWLLVECKAPDCPIDGKTADQIARYLRVLPASLVMATNGVSMHLRALEGGQYRTLKALPPYPSAAGR